MTDVRIVIVETNHVVQSSVRLSQLL